jgi:hypothetical protein
MIQRIAVAVVVSAFAIAPAGAYWSDDPAINLAVAEGAGEQVVPLTADSDMSEVEMFDYSFVYGAGVDFSVRGMQLLLEYRFAIGWNSLAMPTYAYVPFGDEEILIENEPVPLKNQNHLLLIGITF